MRALFLLAACFLVLSGCVHTVSGNRMGISIKRKPLCKVLVTMDTKLVFEGTGAKPCPKE